MPFTPAAAAQLASRANADPVIERFARRATFRALLRRGADEFVLPVIEGRVAPLASGPFVMPQCDFALTGSPGAWDRFTTPHPAPGDQDLFAFFRRGEIVLTGDTRKFFAHQLCLKLVLEKLRSGG